MLRLLQLVTAFIMLGLLPASCARPGQITLKVVEPAPAATQQGILVVTTREPDDPRYGGFSADRAREPSYLRTVVSVPPDHQPGTIAWPRGMPDAETSFAVTGREPLTRRQFAEVAADGGAVMVFVHGYNNNFQESLFRLAQLSVDASIQSTPILFAWPSRAHFAGYVADRDSVTFSRDELVRTLDDLNRSKVPVRILAHSMGSWLAVEALRQLRLQGNDPALDNIEQVVLAAPDIDIDLFRQQMAVVGRLSKPILVLSARDDFALAVSRRLAGASAKVGSLDIDDPRAIELAKENGLQIVDISSVPSQTRLNHDRFVTLATRFPTLSRNAAVTASLIGTRPLLSGPVQQDSTHFLHGAAMLAESETAW